ncbi:AAA family ATPase [bacterium]|nr:AAA family ATPase [bacterium]
MYISKIQISSFRNFKTDVNVEFTPGHNVINGPNNAGKSNLLRALQFIFDRNNREIPEISDFCIKNKDFTPPQGLTLQQQSLNTYCIAACEIIKSAQII